MNEDHQSAALTSTLPRTLVLTMAFYLFFTESAYAYVDPGSGSVIVTTILGFLAAIGYWFRKSFYKITKWFSGRKKPEDETDQDD